jgi:hypothetical protein
VAVRCIWEKNSSQWGQHLLEKSEVVRLERIRNAERVSLPVGFYSLRS